jgi:hypothetical protein
VLGTPGGLPFTATCTRIVAASIKDDMFIFEASVPDSIRAEVLKYLEEYNLADYYPTPYAGLQMLGFPADKYQMGEPTMSENCNVAPSNALGVGNQEYHPGYEAHIRVQLGKHNCNVYGGNSGGPILLRNTHDVVAMPASYYPENYQIGALYESAAMELTKGFIDRNRKSLIQAGVILSKEPVRTSGTYQRLKFFETYQNFSAEKDSSYQIHIEKTDRKLGTIEISFSKDGGRTFHPSVKFFCEDDQSNRGFCYYQPNNQKRSWLAWHIEIALNNKLMLTIINGQKADVLILKPDFR